MNRAWFRPPRHLLVLYVLLTLVPSMLLLAFGWRLLQQDVELEQQADARREEAADVFVAALERAITATEQKLADPEAFRFLATTPDSISVAFSEGQLEALPHGRLLYYPLASPGSDAPVAARAAALIAAARDLRKSGEYDAALTVYSEASRLATTAIGEVPTELFARWARCDLLDHLGRRTQLAREALELRELLLEGRWRITRPVFDVHMEGASRWARAGEPPANHRLALSDAVDRLWSMQGQTALAEGSGRMTLAVNGTQFTVLWRRAGDRTTALIAGPAFVDQEWKRSKKEKAG